MYSLKILLALFIVALSTGILRAQETKTINGRIISEGLEPLPKAIIYSMDTTALGSTDTDGYFQIKVPVRTNDLLLGFIGMEWTSVKIKDDCQYLEMIMMTDVIYDFISIKKINRKRHKRLKLLPKMHQKAYEQGIFKSSNSCVCYVFKKY